MFTANSDKVTVPGRRIVTVVHELDLLLVKLEKEPTAKIKGKGNKGQGGGPFADAPPLPTSNLSL